MSGAAPSGDLYLKRLLLGSMENYVYLVGSRSAREVWAVDPAWEIDAIVDAAAADDLEITGILVTHYHPDHVGGDLFGHRVDGIAALLERRAVPVHVHRAERDGLAQVTGVPAKDMVAHDGGDVVQIGALPLKLLHTPGHTPGSQCFLAENSLISGDTLFYGNCGRVDLPGGDPEQMYKSLHHVLKRLPEETQLYPGHQYGTVTDSTIGEEIRTNPVLKVPSLEAWLRGHGC